MLQCFASQLWAKCFDLSHHKIWLSKLDAIHRTILHTRISLSLLSSLPLLSPIALSPRRYLGLPGGGAVHKRSSGNRSVCIRYTAYLMRYLRLDTWGCQAGVRYINATLDALAQCKIMRYLRLDTWGCQAGMRYINALQNSKQDPYGLVGEGSKRGRRQTRDKSRRQAKATTGLG